MLDYIGIFKALNKKKIRYITVGGIAVNLHGIPRMTYDMDLILDLEDNNLRKFLRLLKKWGFKPKVPVDIMDFSKENKRMEWIKKKNMKAFTLVNPNWGISEVDIVINTPLDYKKAVKKVKWISLKDTLIPVIGIQNLIKMKQVSNRLQDKADIKNLKKLYEK